MENDKFYYQDLKFKYSFESVNEYNEGASFEKEIRLDVTCLIFDEPGKEYVQNVGYAEMTYWNRALFMRTSNWHPEEFCDSLSHSMIEMYLALFDRRMSWIKKEYQQKLKIVDDYDLDICLVTRMVLYPEFRGLGLEKYINFNMSEQIGSHALIVGKPFPLQFEDERFRQDGDGIDGCFEEKDFAKALAKVRTSHIKNGYKELSKDCDFLAIPPFGLKRFRKDF